MTVAVLNDIHGNLLALEAVLAEPDVQNADTIVIGGDLIPGPRAAEVVERVRGLGRRAQLIRGNGEREVCEVLLELSAVDDDVSSWVKRRLDLRDIAKLRELPTAVEIDGTIYCHATPTRDDRMFTMLTPDEDVLEAVDPVTSGLLSVAHTHSQFDRTIGDLRIFNAGSVGLAYEGSPGARWALVDGPQVYMNTTEYDVEAEAAACEASGFPNAEWATWLRTPPTAEEASTHFETLRHESRS